MRQQKAKTGIQTVPTYKIIGHCNECGFPLYKYGDKDIRHMVAEPPPCTQREAEKKEKKK